MSTISLKKVGLFVDWYTQLLSVPKEFSNDPNLACQHAMRSVGSVATKYLCALDRSTVFRVRMRLYHGWTTGITHTPNRNAIAKSPDFLNPDSIFPSIRVVSLTEIEFGDRLIDALPTRENTGLRIHLPNTYRAQDGRGEKAEKMVDTALASDLLSWARNEPDSIALVFSSDDDIVPPVFTAEAWMKPFGGIVKINRPPARKESKFLSLEGLLT